VFNVEKKLGEGKRKNSIIVERSQACGIMNYFLVEWIYDYTNPSISLGV
jgi:hypothetical protein